MAKLNYQKLSKQSRLNSQPVINLPAKKALTLENAPRTRYGKTKPRSLWQDIGTETVFLSGKFKGTDIGKLYKENPSYFLWVLENQSKGIVAQQIVAYFNKQADKI